MGVCKFLVIYGSSFWAASHGDELFWWYLGICFWSWCVLQVQGPGLRECCDELRVYIECFTAPSFLAGFMVLGFRFWGLGLRM